MERPRRSGAITFRPEAGELEAGRHQQRCRHVATPGEKVWPRFEAKKRRPWREIKGRKSVLTVTLIVNTLK